MLEIIVGILQEKQKYKKEMKIGQRVLNGQHIEQIN